MAENSKIEWTDHTFNPWIGCQKVSPGCDHCYAETQNKFRNWTGGGWGPHAPRKQTSEANWRKPLQWARAARDAGGRRPRVFCASLADVFDKKAQEGARADLFALIRETPELDWQLLTKRPQNIRRMLPKNWGDGYPNVWLGTTCEDQKHYQLRYSYLAAVPARQRFISYEPALGPILLNLIAPQVRIPDWIICGGESGAGARDMETAWARSMLDQCRLFGIAFFMKQMTGKKPIPADLLVRQFPTARMQEAA